MLNVYFENVITRQRRRIGPVALLKIAGTLLLDDRSTYNPAWLVNGAIRAGDTQQLALARLDEQTGAWHVYADRTFWSSAVFSPAA